MAENNGAGAKGRGRGRSRGRARDATQDLSLPRPGGERTVGRAPENRTNQPGQPWGNSQSVRQPWGNSQPASGNPQPAVNPQVWGAPRAAPAPGLGQQAGADGGSDFPELAPRPTNGRGVLPPTDAPRRATGRARKQAPTEVAPGHNQSMNSCNRYNRDTEEVSQRANQGAGPANQGAGPANQGAGPANQGGRGAGPANQGGVARPANQGGRGAGPANQGGVARPANQGGRGADPANQGPRGLGELGAQRGRRRGGLFAPLPQSRLSPADLAPVQGPGQSRLIQVTTNFFQLEMPELAQIFQYHVSFNPDVDNPRTRRWLVMTLAPVDALRARTFDGMTLFTSGQLPEATNEYVRDIGDSRTTRVTITLTGEVHPSSPAVLQLYNLVLRRAMGAAGMVQTDQYFFNPHDSHEISQYRLDIRPGFMTSIRQFERGVMLLSDVIHKIVHQGTVYQMIADLMQRRQTVEAIKAQITGLIVITKYNNKTYRIDDVEDGKNLRETFDKNGQTITLAQYYDEMLPRASERHPGENFGRITDLDQWLLVVRQRIRNPETQEKETKILYLVPELCFITGLPDDMRRNYQVMNAVGNITRLTPESRRQRLENFMRTIQNNPHSSDELSRWGMRFQNQLHTISARVMQPLEVFMASDRGVPKSLRYQGTDWTRNLSDSRLVTPATMSDWLMVATRKEMNIAVSLVQALVRVGLPLGIRVPNPQYVELNDDRTHSYTSGIVHNLTPTIKMVMCLTGTDRKDRYDAIKRTCCVSHPVPSQVVVRRTVVKKEKLLSIATKLAIQMSCKMGGVAWKVNIPLKTMMLIGMDVNHDTKSTTGRGSVLGFVSTMNGDGTRYYSQTSRQKWREELANTLTALTVIALRQWYEVNGALPKQVVVYRDGVGDGQLAAVIDSELRQIKAALTQTANNDESRPSLTMIIVKKSVNARFMQPSPRGLVNPPAGTVVDGEVTHAELSDFYLIPQTVRQGTVTPTHYNIIHNDCPMLNMDRIQSLTYKQCHLYANWPGTIRVPAPCQYAHKVAFLSGESLGEDAHVELRDRLYYL